MDKPNKRETNHSESYENNYYKLRYNRLINSAVPTLSYTSRWVAISLKGNQVNTSAEETHS